VDLSALIFVALAVAWAVYLVPKALRQHEAGESSRSIESFSERVRVLGRRPEPDVHVVHPGQPAGTARPVSPSGPSPAARRRRVLAVVLALLVVVGVLAATGVLGWGWIALPLVVLVAWLVACRLMVRSERAARQRPLAAPHTSVVESGAAVVQPGEPQRARVETPEPLETNAEAEPATDLADDHTDEIRVEQVPVEFDPETGAPVAWDPVPVTLPTYVGKEQAARRAVRTIDLDSTGVWTSGRSESDSALAREADESSRAARAARRERDAAELADRRRASGS